MSLNVVFMSVAITCANRIIKIVGTERVTTVSRYSCGTICINAMLRQLAYPTHLTGFATFSIALKYSLIANTAIIAKAMSTTILFPSNKIITTKGNPNKLVVILFTFIFFSFLSSFIY